MPRDPFIREKFTSVRKPLQAQVLEGRFSTIVFRPRSPTLRLVLHLIFISAVAFTAPSLAQKLVDPNSVAPEFREAAEKRRAEQIKVVECNRKANEAKVLPRDRTGYLTHCLDAAGEK
jgi:hypothetical protein